MVAKGARFFAGLILGFVAQGSPIWAESPLSAIDWLSQSVTVPPKPAPRPKSVAQKPKGPAIVKGGALPEDVAVSVLGGPSPDGVGLLSPAQTGFPVAIWGLAKTDEVVSALAQTNPDGLPTLQSLLVTLLLAESEPPADAGEDGLILIARIDKLLGIGALDQAQALLDAAAPAKSAAMFRRSFDVALLTGNEDRACQTLQASPELSPTLPTRVFCLARAGDWNAAALTLRTSQALGHITLVEDALLSRFLDPDLYENDPVPTPPNPVTPLIWRIYEAIGEPLPTAMMPLAFAHAELSERAGWKSQVEAAERLARVGAITPNLLLGLYTERDPAASGGVWDRVAAFQRFDDALQAKELGQVEQRLPLAYARMKDVELEVPFAALFAGDLAKLPLSGDAARIGYELGLLSPSYARLAIGPLAPTDVRGRFLTGIAAGLVDGLPAPDSMARAIAPAFAATPMVLDPDAQLLIDQKRLGEAILLAMQRISAGLQGELGKVTQGLSLLRALGLEDVARRTALELMILERRG